MNQPPTDRPRKFSLLTVHIFMGYFPCTSFYKNLEQVHSIPQVSLFQLLYLQFTRGKSHSKATILHFCLLIFFFFFSIQVPQGGLRAQGNHHFLNALKSDSSSWLPMQLCRVGLEYVMNAQSCLRALPLLFTQWSCFWDLSQSSHLLAIDPDSLVLV